LIRELGIKEFFELSMNHSDGTTEYGAKELGAEEWVQFSEQVLPHPLPLTPLPSTPLPNLVQGPDAGAIPLHLPPLHEP
jgi:hypothetical protein